MAILLHPTSIQGSTPRARQVCMQLKKPSQVEAKVLGTLFPSSAATRKRCSPSFDPTAENVALPQQKKKKAARAKPSTITVIPLRSYQKNLPKRNNRKELNDQQRVQKLQFQRNSTPLQVRNVIMRGFHHIHGFSSYTVLECDANNYLKKSQNQEVDGEGVVSRRGCLYLCEEHEVCFLTFIVKLPVIKITYTLFIRSVMVSITVTVAQTYHQHHRVHLSFGSEQSICYQN